MVSLILLGERGLCRASFCDSTGRGAAGAFAMLNLEGASICFSCHNAVNRQNPRDFNPFMTRVSTALHSEVNMILVSIESTVVVVVFFALIVVPQVPILVPGHAGVENQLVDSKLTNLCVRGDVRQ